MNELAFSGLFLVYVLSLTSSTTTYVAPTLPKVEISSPESIKGRISYYAEYYKVSETTLNNVVKCESGYNPQAVGDNGTSHGLVQIHLPAHPYISDAEAHNVEFSLDFLARMIKAGRGAMWTCFRMN